AACRDDRPGHRMDWPAMGSPAGLLRRPAAPGVMEAYRRRRGRDALGLGGVKLAAVAGAWLGWVTITAVVELAGPGGARGLSLDRSAARPPAAGYGLPAIQRLPGPEHLARLAG